MLHFLLFLFGILENFVILTQYNSGRYLEFCFIFRGYENSANYMKLYLEMSNFIPIFAVTKEQRHEREIPRNEKLLQRYAEERTQ